MSTTYFTIARQADPLISFQLPVLKRPKEHLGRIKCSKE